MAFFSRVSKEVEPRRDAPFWKPDVISGRLRLIDGVLPVVFGVLAVGAFVGVLVRPALVPILAPLAVLSGIAAGWLGLQVNQRRLNGKVHQLVAENAGLATIAAGMSNCEEPCRSLIDAQGDLIVHRDGDGIVIFVNKAFVDTFGLTHDEVIGRPLEIKVLSDEADGLARCPGSDNVLARDLELETKGGPRWYSWVDIKMSIPVDGAGVVYSVARDISARKGTEHALLEARRRAESANLAKSGFLAAVSHEFRTPLNGILGLTGLLLESRLTPEQETYCRGVLSSGEALLRLVDDILDFSSIEAGRFELRPEPTDVAALVQDIGELLAPRAHAKTIDMAIEIGSALPARALVDPTRLRQILVNLLGNAVKFTDSGGLKIEAESWPGADEGKARIVFSVSDSGPGIDPSEAERIFGEFEQIESVSGRGHGGTGLGLAISRRIVRRMDGDIVHCPRPGGGTIFSFALDLPIVEGAPTALEQCLSGQSAMIVAPDGSEPPVLADYLREAGADVLTLGDFTAAVSHCEAANISADTPSVLLIDYRTEPDPVAALSRLRLAAGRRLPAVILIEPGNRGALGALREAGFDAYLVRPVRRRSLVKIVADVLAAPGTIFRADPEDVGPPIHELPTLGERHDVLLAEDNDVNALLVRSILRRLGYGVTEVSDGAAAVSAATSETKRFPVILMDLHMPGLDGIAAASLIRDFERRRWKSRATIIALTADVLPETRFRAVEAGIDAVLEKPITPEKLRRIMAEVMDQPVESSAG